jgi:hypothetical protein
MALHCLGHPACNLIIILTEIPAPTYSVISVRNFVQSYPIIYSFRVIYK